MFAPKYCREVIYKKWKADIESILRELCDSKGVNIVEAKCCLNPIHMLVEIALYLSISSFIGYL